MKKMVSSLFAVALVGTATALGQKELPNNRSAPEDREKLKQRAKLRRDEPPLHGALIMPKATTNASDSGPTRK